MVLSENCLLIHNCLVPPVPRYPTFYLSVSNPDILLARFPKDRQEDECTFLLGTYVELVDREVVLKEKELLVDTLIGVLRTKTVSARSRAVPQVQIALT